MNYVFLENWHDFMPREAGHVVAFMGSGGKTSLMMETARVLGTEGVPVVLTTTTRTEPLKGVTVVELADLREGPLGGDGPDEGPRFVRAGCGPDGKWSGLTCREVDGLVARFPSVVILVEVDGAAKLPLKIHRPDEPLWPALTSLAVVVMGAGAVGCRAGEVVHRFGREHSLPLADHAEWSLVEWDNVAGLLLGEGGYLDRVPTGVPAVLALAGLGGQPDSIGLFEFVARAMSDPRLPLVMFCETGADPPSLRTACRHGKDEA